MKGPWALYRARIDRGDLTPDAAQEEAARRLERLAKALARWRPEGWFNAQPAPPGLYLYGAVGRGKSMLMDLFFEAAPVKRKRRVHFHEFMQEQHRRLRDARARGDTGNDRLIQTLAKEAADAGRLLCFDELQVTDIADAMILGRLFQHLFEQNVVIVATSNRAPDELYKNGLNRQLVLPFIALLKERMDVAELAAAQDFRRAQLIGAAVYHTPLNGFTDSVMDKTWARLTSGAHMHPVTLDIAGRSLKASRAAAGCVRFSFAELCEAALGPGDYLAIAERFHTVFLERVPRLGPDMKEAAARFRILIDALYEARATLIMSAEAGPDVLYTAGAQSFEFERTASRLHEMQSAAYLSQPHRDKDFMRGVID
jgi:cell division protein ZapE